VCVFEEDGWRGEEVEDSREKGEES